MPIWQSDQELFALMESELFTAVVGDIMDSMGLIHQFLPPQIKPIAPDMMVVGRAMTVLETDTVQGDYPGANPLLKQPFGLMLQALDGLQAGEVYICTGSSPEYALWGELMCTRAHILGAAGAVLNGYHRDTKGIISIGFPTFSYGCYAQDQAPRGKVIDYRVPILIGQVCIQPGDIVFGDLDGVLIIPAVVENEVVEKALEKARGEKEVEKAIKSGMPTEDAFRKFGIM